MLNQIGFASPPDDLILDPYAGQGLTALSPPDFLWRPIPRPQIHGFAVSAPDQINAKIQNFLSVTEGFKLFPQATKFNTFPVHRPKRFRVGRDGTRSRILTLG